MRVNYKIKNYISYITNINNGTNDQDRSKLSKRKCKITI